MLMLNARTLATATVTLECVRVMRVSLAMHVRYDLERALDCHS